MISTENNTVGNALVIGGSGMLRGVSLWLASEGYATAVIGRSRQRLSSLVAENPSIIPLSLDYHDLKALKAALEVCVHKDGSFDLVVAWIHSQQKEVLDVVREVVEAASGSRWQLYLVLGSRADREAMIRDISPSEYCEYHSIQLGYRREHGESRWLTHEEITDGILSALQERKDVLVGQLEPHHLRP